MYVKLLLFSNKNKINKAQYSDPSKVWFNSRGLIVVLSQLSF